MGHWRWQCDAYDFITYSPPACIFNTRQTTYVWCRRLVEFSWVTLKVFFDIVECRERCVECGVPIRWLVWLLAGVDGWRIAPFCQWHIWKHPSALTHRSPREIKLFRMHYEFGKMENECRHWRAPSATFRVEGVAGKIMNICFYATHRN